MKTQQPITPSHPFYFLSSAFIYPEHNILRQYSEALSSLAVDMGLKKIDHEGMGTGGHEALQAEYMRLFVTAPGGVCSPPYASIYIQNRGILFQQGHDLALEFYLKAGLEPVASGESADHISHELAFIGKLLDTENIELLRDFLTDHVLQWYPSFLQLLLNAQPGLFYRTLGQITDLCFKHIEKEVVHEQETFS